MVKCSRGIYICHRFWFKFGLCIGIYFPEIDYKLLFIQLENMNWISCTFANNYIIFFISWQPPRLTWIVIISIRCIIKLSYNYKEFTSVFTRNLIGNWVIRCSVHICLLLRGKIIYYYLLTIFHIVFCHRSKYTILPMHHKSWMI